MPHVGRMRSKSGYYHVVPKGMANQLIFESDQDRLAYLEYLSQAKNKYKVVIHAYCLMSNHAHLVIEDPDDTLSEAVKYVHERYAMRFAEATGRKGGVFAKPFWSEPIESDGYLLCAVRYVHANPHAAGICPASAYPWSSVRQYLGRCDGIAYTEAILDMLGGRAGFVEFSRQSNSTLLPFPESKLRGHLSDEEALVIAQDVTDMDVRTLRQLEKDVRQKKLTILLQHGFSGKLIMRLTGVSEYEVKQTRSRPKGE